MANRLLRTVSTTIAFSFSNGVLTATISNRGISQSSNNQMFTTRRYHAFSSTFSLFNRVLLRVIFSAIFSRPQVFTRVMYFIKVGVLRYRFRRIVKFVHQDAGSFLQGLHDRIIINVFQDSIFSNTKHHRPIR